MRSLASILLACVLIPAAANATTTVDEIESLRRDVAQARRTLDELEARLSALDASASTSAAEPPPAVAPPGGGPRLRLLDLSLNGLFAAGGSTASHDDLGLLNAGGHDPHQRGFNVQNVELSLLGAIDPYLKGETHVVLLLDEEGETAVELEEAFVTTQSLPAGLQLKAGHYFTEFGRHNPQHPHSWSFVSQPVISSRLLGPDGMRGPGARLSWLTPAPWYSELFAGVQQSSGETMPSFFGTSDGGAIGGHPNLGGRIKSPDDVLATARWLNSIPLTKQSTLNLGASYATGPNGSGAGMRTGITGLDAYLKWQGASSAKGFPFVAWQGEWMRRRYDAGAFTDDAGVDIAQETLTDTGWYSQVTWGFRPGWTVGGRLDRASGSRSLALSRAFDPLRDSRTRFSAALNWFPSEFSRIRFEYDYDRAQFLSDRDAHAFWIQWEFTLGAHGAHQF